MEYLKPVSLVPPMVSIAPLPGNNNSPENPKDKYRKRRILDIFNHMKVL
jgi:hypothetical protein